jgi:hypothetical protein
MFPVSQSYVVVLKSEGSSFGEMVGFLYLTREDWWKGMELGRRMK